MTGPTVRARQLGLALAELRTAAGVTQRQAAAELECSQGTIAKVEHGKARIDRAALIVLLQLYGVDDKTINDLDALRLMAGERGWWSTYDLPDWLAGYVGLEHDATGVRTFDLELIPGLLQIEGYARELHTVYGVLPTQDVDARVAVRLQRQARITTEGHPLALSAVVSQGALERCAVTSDQVGRAQLRHLHDAAQLPNVRVQILPFSHGRHAGMAGAFTLLSFADGTLPDVAWQEYIRGGHIIDDDLSVSHLGRTYDQVSGQALTCDASLTWLAGILS